MTSPWKTLLFLKKPWNAAIRIFGFLSLLRAWLRLLWNEMEGFRGKTYEKAFAERCGMIWTEKKTARAFRLRRLL
jgi:hypothetical protein